MPSRQRGLDETLLRAQPVERGIDLFGGGSAKPQHLAQRVTGGAGIEHPCGGQLGGGLKHPRDDQANRKIAFAVWPATRQQGREIDAPCGADRCKHMTVRQSADDLHRINGR